MEGQNNLGLPRTEGSRVTGTLVREGGGAYMFVAGSVS